MADGKPVKVVDLYKVIKEECDGIVKKCDIFMDDQPNVVSEAANGILSLTPIQIRCTYSVKVRQLLTLVTVC